MITLNILPEKKQREYELVRTYRFLISFFEAVLFITACATILLIIARSVLRTRVEQVFQAPIAVEPIVKQTEERVRSLNALVHMIDTVQQKTPLWSPFIEELVAITPTAVDYSSIRAERDGRLEIRGVAATRNDLLELKNRLSASSQLTDLEFPLANLLYPERVPFEIRGKIRTEQP